MLDFKHAINTLTVDKDTVTTNEKSNRRKGNINQADLERAIGKSDKAAIGALTRHQAILETLKKMHRKQKEK